MQLPWSERLFLLLLTAQSTAPLRALTFLFATCFALTSLFYFVVAKPVVEI